jgi:hypothetical protein
VQVPAVLQESGAALFGPKTTGVFNEVKKKTRKNLLIDWITDDSDANAWPAC